MNPTDRDRQLAEAEEVLGDRPRGDEFRQGTCFLVAI